MSSCRAPSLALHPVKERRQAAPRMSSTVWLASIVRRWSSRASAGAQPRR